MTALRAAPRVFICEKPNSSAIRSALDLVSSLMYWALRIRRCSVLISSSSCAMSILFLISSAVLAAGLAELSACDASISEAASVSGRLSASSLSMSSPSSNRSANSGSSISVLRTFALACALAISLAVVSFSSSTNTRRRSSRARSMPSVASIALVEEARSLRSIKEVRCRCAFGRE